MRTKRQQEMVDSFFDLIVLPALLVAGLVTLLRPKKSSP
jgi:hypothetical protein